MKQIKSVLLFVLLFGISEVYSINPLRLNLIQQPNLEASKSLYATYTPEQKSIVWIDKIEHTISSNVWTDQQLDMLLNMKARLNPDVFTDGSSQQQSFDLYYNDFEVNGINIFGKMNFARIFITPEDYSNTSAPTGGEPGSGCECCLKCTFTCDWFTGGSSCDKSLCSGSKRGCGGLWAQTCDGDCALNMGNSTSSPVNNR